MAEPIRPGEVASRGGCASASNYGGAGWRFTADPLTPDADETWSDWRGYRNPRVTSGANGHAHSTYYWRYRGLDGDRTSKTDPSATRSVTVTDSTGTQWPDSAWLAGRVLETSHRDDSSGSPVSRKRVRHRYWAHNTAQYTGLPDARFVREKRTTTLTRISTSTSDQSTWREHVVQHEYDASEGASATFGLPLRTEDWGESGVSDNRCTTFGRAYNTDDLNAAGVQRWTVLEDEVRTYSVGCTSRAASNRTSYAVTLYDGAGSVAGNKPVDGNATEVREYTDDLTHRATRASYDAAGRVTEAWDARGNKTTSSHSPANSWPLNGVTVTGPDPDGTGPGTPLSSTTWYSRFWGTPWKTTDANGNTTRIELDGAGRTAKVWKPTEYGDYPSGSASLVFTYTTPTATSSSGVPDAVSGPSRVTSKTLQSGTAYLVSHAYADGFGRARETQTAAPGGTGRNVVSTRYDSSGNVTGTSAAFYNSGAAGSGMVLPAVADLPSYSDVVPDWAGRTTESKIMVNGVNQSAGRTLTAYHGDYTRVTPPAGGATDTHTDVYGQTAKVVEHHDGDTYTTAYGYTDRGQLATITDTLGNVTTYTYNWHGERTATDDPDAGSSTTSYDAGGNVQTATNAAGVTLTHTYDALNRLVETREGTTLITSHTYDTPTNGKGLPATSTSYAGGAYTSAVTAYDARGRAFQKQLTVPAVAGELAGTYTVGLHYDAAGHVTATDYPAIGGLPAETLTAEYTDQGLVSTLSSPLATYVADTDYDNLARLTGRAYGTEATTGTTASRAYTYDDTNGTSALRTVQASTSTGGLVQDDTLDRNDAGIPTAVTDGVAAQRECFRYDPLNRLTAAWTTAAATQCAATGTPNADFTAGPDPYRTEYAYDPIGNLQSVTDTTASGSTTEDYRYPGYNGDESAYTPGADRPHAVVQAGADTYAYNAAGQLTTRTVDGLTSTFEWNGQNRVRAVTQRHATGDEETSYVYDAGGNPLMRTSAEESVLYLDGHEIRSTPGTTGTRATRYYVSGQNTVAMRAASPTESDGVLTWLMGDGQASTQLVILAATGTVSRRRYTPFGAQRGTTALPDGTDRGFLGQPEDDTTGLSILGARMYDPALGRFLSTDELVAPYDPQNLGAYIYSRNNPIAFSDPTGLWCDGCNGGNGWPAPDGYTEEEPYTPETIPNAPTGGGGNGGGGGGGSEGPRFIESDDLGSSRCAYTGNVCNSGFWDIQYTDYRGDWSELWQMGKELVLPDVEAWEACLADHQLSGCGWAALDLPWFKAVKGGKVILKGAKKAGNCPVRGHSFLPDTQVLLSDGTRKDIEDVEIGDEVVVTDPETGETTTRVVVVTIVTADDKNFVDVTVTTDDGPASLVSTVNHPFWSESEARWTDAGDLKAGTILRTPDGDTVTVTATRHFTQRQRTHDLTIDDIHTYYVLAGDTPVLVHNSGGCPDLDALSQSGMRPAKGKTTHAGREYQKHMNRGDLPVVPGKELKTAGQDLLDDVLTNPQTTRSAVNSGNFAGGTRYIMPDPAGGRGIGATFDENGQFQYFGRY